MQPSAKAYHLLATSMLLGACSYAPRATVAGTGSVTFSHDKLSPEMHMLVVTANPGVLEVGSSGGPKPRIRKSICYSDMRPHLHFCVNLSQIR